ncbi:MAG: hypothetical protein JW829_06890, partial [Pirellulales bacterium]|nr:hypothetical protein [Pirellulales bacterium]
NQRIQRTGNQVGGSLRSVYSTPRPLILNDKPPVSFEKILPCQRVRRVAQPIQQCGMGVAEHDSTEISTPRFPVISRTRWMDTQ